ncbi:MAG TPA: aminotransferase class I/II-fold pyridoxal phosphate-dependent enzyme [Vicinamibacterales bacterium]|nr:aminotransferase class I/II-fold pyridoxal phosphate-dependent enzyme [Vicinamibacterales bacterium]
MRPATQIVQGSQGGNRDAEPLTTPIYETTTFIFEDAAEVRAYNEGRTAKFLYTRYGNPTVAAVEKTLAAIEGAETAMLLGSGMAATSTALLALLKSGDEVVCSAAIYGGTLHLLADMFPHYGIQVRFATLDELSRPDQLLGDKTRVLWFESPINPTLRCVDVAAIASACRKKGVISIIDNTFASPLNQQPIALGVDMVMESVTKYINGHSDVTAGLLAGSAALLKDVEKARRMLGGIIDPQAAYAIGRGLKTLDVRIERHNASGLAVARWLEKDKRIAKVYYPGLESHPDHALAKKQMKGFGGMVCLDVGGGQDRAERFFDRLKVFRRAASLGGVESLCSLPVLTSQWGHTDAQLADAGVTRSMARLSIGLEDPQDLIEDLDQALNSAWPHSDMSN